MNPTPLLTAHEQAEASFMDYGSAGRIVATFGSIELEYGSMRRCAGLLDCPHRGLLQLTGSARLAFLQRLVTNDLAGMAAGQGVRAFFLNNKGRIVADMVILQEEERTLIDLDAVDAPGVAQELSGFIFQDDVKVEDLSQSYHRLSLHGPQGHDLLRQITGMLADQLPDYQHQLLSSGVSAGVVYRRDQVDELGLHIWLPVDAVGAAHSNLVTSGEGQGLKEIGWLAFNVARVEAGVPLFHIDFGPESLPHETGLVKEAVSFTKGCYTGQEVVARIEHLGHPARQLVAFKVEESRAIPLSGEGVYESLSAEAAVGAVTSSSFSPLMGDAAIGLAMVRWGQHEPGTRLFTVAQGQRVPMVVRPLGSTKAV